MPKYLDIERVPVNWQQVTGKTWAITGLRVAESANSIYIDSSTGRASGYYFDELGIASTGIYATSGQFSVANPVLTWGLVHPAREGYPARGFAFDPFFKGFEISILDRDANFKSGIGFEEDGRISKVELISGGSGYLSPKIYVSGDGTGAAVEVETFGSGLFANISGYSPSHISGYRTGIASIKIISGGSGYTAGNAHLVISGSGNDQYTIGQLATIQQGGDELSAQGSGAFAQVSSDGLGLRTSYYDGPFVEIPLETNKRIFGGDGERNFQVQVVTRDYYDNLSTGRMQLEFPTAKFEDFGLIKASNEIIFGLTVSGVFEQNKNFIENSLRKIEIHRGPSSDFSIVTGSERSNTNFFTQDSFAEEIVLPKSLFSEADYYSGYFYKLLPYDNFGTGELLSINTGIRLNRSLSILDAPSGFRTLVDQSKTIGTNIEGDVITNTYLSWKKDRDLNIKQYEVVVEDQVEKESYVSIINTPAISGINYLISGTGSSGRADFDKDSRIKLPAKDFPRTIFDIFQPYSTNGVQWADHTLYLDNDYLDNLPNENSVINRQFVEIPAGNTSSGYVYFTGIGNHHGQEMSYAAADTFIQPGEQSETHALVARNTNNEVIVEYEPRIKIPTKKDGSYSFKVRSVSNAGRKSLYAETQTFTASGAKSHFRFNPIDTNLELGGTGTITSSGPFVTTVGGKNITAVGTGVVVIGGIDNRATGELSALVGGSGNRLMGAAGPPAEASFMGGGRLNVISGHRSVLVGGEGNLISGDAQALLGGQYNTIFGGPETSYHESSSIDFEHSIIGGGTLNVISGDRSFIGGGNRNTIGVNVARSSLTYGLDINSSSWSKFANYSIINSAIVGGKENELYSSYSFIGGGYGNKAYEGNGPTKAFGNAIVGGRDNVISGDETAGTVVLGGRYNEGRAPYTVVGGYKSTGAGWYGVALGAYAASAHDGAMVLADGTTPSIEDGSIAKKSHGEHTLNLFFENGAYLRNGSLYISGDLHVSGAADFAGGGAAIDGVGVAGYIASWTDANTIQTGGLYNLAGGNVNRRN